MVTQAFHNSAAAKDIRKATLGLENRFKTIAKRLGNNAPLLGIAAFVPDAVHLNDADVLTVVNTKKSGQDHRKFVKEQIKGRRIFLPATAAGEAMQKGGQSFSESRMNPDEHLVMNIPFDEDHGVNLVQLAFSRSVYKTPENLQRTEEHQIQRIFANQRRPISTVFNRIAHLAGPDNSLSEALALNVPSIPNTFLMNWDLGGSSALAHSSYPQLRQLLVDFKRRLYQDVPTLKENLLREEGDGQWLNYTIPESDYYSPEQYLKATVLPTARRIMDVYDLVKMPSGLNIPKGQKKPSLRITIGMGHLENNVIAFNPQKRELNGPVFWDVSKLSKNTTRTGNCIAACDNVLRLPGVASSAHPPAQLLEHRPT